MKVRSACSPPSFNCLASDAETLTTLLSFAKTGVTSTICVCFPLLRPMTLKAAMIGSAVDAVSVLEILLLGSATCERTYALSSKVLLSRC